MNVNDTVIYTESEKDYVATVLEIRELENHLGKNGEPLLHLGFFAPVFKPSASGIPTRVSLVGTHQQYDLCQFRLDVAHVTHEFDAKLKLPTYQGGRWKEATVVANPEIFDEDQEEEIIEPETAKSIGLPTDAVPQEQIDRGKSELLPGNTADPNAGGVEGVEGVEGETNAIVQG